MQPDRALPPYTDAFTLANEMGEFFVHKITSIRSKLTTDDQSDVMGGETTDACNVDITFSEFSPLSEQDVRKLALAKRIRSRVRLTQFHRLFNSVPGRVTSSVN
jgi:hypothetical protein